MLQISTKTNFETEVYELLKLFDLSRRLKHDEEISNCSSTPKFSQKTGGISTEILKGQISECVLQDMLIKVGEIKIVNIEKEQNRSQNSALGDTG